MQSAFLPLAVAALAGAEPSINGGASRQRTVISTQGLCGVEGGRAGSLSLCSSTMPFPFLNHHKRNCAAAVLTVVQSRVNQPIDILYLCYCEVACNELKLLFIYCTLKIGQLFLNFLEKEREREREREGARKRTCKR